MGLSRLMYDVATLKIHTDYKNGKKKMNIFMHRLLIHHHNGKLFILMNLELDFDAVNERVG